LNEQDLLDAGQQSLVIGWGCPLETPISNVREMFGSELLGYINFFLPISEMVSIMAIWLISIAAYYVASVVLRWVKAIS